MTDDRPPIPAEVELEVRQRCGFACVVCGLPLYEYHHIRPWSEVPEHDPANIVLVCPNHHAEVTKGLLDPTTLESLSKCDKPSISTPHKMHYAGDTCKVYFGDSDWISAGTPDAFFALVVDNVPLLGFQFRDGSPLLHLELLNENNYPILRSRGGFVQHVRDYWDIKWKGRRLTLRDRPGFIRFDATFEVPDTIRIHRALFLCNGVAIKIAPKGIACLNNGMTFSFAGGIGGNSENLDSGTQVAIALGAVSQDVQRLAGLTCSGIHRYSGIDLKQRVRGPKH